MKMYYSPYGEVWTKEEIYNHFYKNIEYESFEEYFDTEFSKGYHYQEIEVGSLTFDESEIAAEYFREVDTDFTNFQDFINYLLNDEEAKQKILSK